MLRAIVMCFAICLLAGCGENPDAEKPLVPTQEQLDNARENGIGERQMGREREGEGATK